MSGGRTAVMVVLGMSMAACAGSPARTSTAPALMEGHGTEDVVRLTNGEVLKGRILEENARNVVVERDERVVTVPRAAVYSIDYSKESWKEKNARLSASEVAPEGARPAASWYARAHPSERVEQTEVLWFDGHPMDECVGAPLAKAHAEIPDLRIFAEPGGRIVLHDPRRWGYHAHGFPAGFHKPGAKPGLSIELGKAEADLPSALAFVSPSQEMKSQEAERGSYTPPDSVYAVVKPLTAAEGTLAVQPFAGGKPTETRNGTMWAFTLPRNARQFYLYLMDPAKKHGETLKAAFAGYGDTILAPDLMIDSVAADGTTVGRLMVLPFPDGLAADGPAPEAVTVYSGPTQDPARVAAASVPPRQSVQTPSKASSTKATLLVSHFEVSPNIPQTAITAWGTGRPSTGEVALDAKELKAKEADLLVRLDLSKMSEDRFPAVAWFYHRRTYAWKSTGGRSEPAAATVAMPEPVKLTKVKKSEPIPHVLPLLFQGPKADVAVAAGVPPVTVSGGMSTSLMADSFAREAGGVASSALTSSLTNPGAPAGGGAAPGQVSSVTNVYITSPTHAPTGGAEAGPLSGATARSPAGVYMSRTPGWNGGPSPNPWGLGAMGPVGTEQAGVYRDSRGNVIYDSSTGTAQSQTGIGGIGVDPITHNPTVTFTRRNR